MRNSTDDLDLSIFWELGDTNAREYIRIKYGLETESEAMKALERFDSDMRQNEVGQNFGIIYHKK